MSKTEWTEKAEEFRIDELYSGVVAILLKEEVEVPMVPRENRDAKAGFGVIPFIYANCTENAQVTLPSQAALKRELFGVLRSAKAPKKISGETFMGAFKDSTWQEAEYPQLRWPELLAPEEENVRGEYNSVHTLAVTHVTRFRPAEIVRNKYSHGIMGPTVGLEAINVDPRFMETATSLMGASLAKNSMKVRNSAMNKIRRVEEEFGIRLHLPWSTSEATNFILACVKTNLRPNTIRNYVSQIKMLHESQGLHWGVKMAIPESILRGLENTKEVGNKRIAVTPGMLRSMKMAVRDSGWCQQDRRMFWLLLAFLWSGSFRISELLAPTETGFIGEETACWSRLSTGDSMICGKKIRWVAIKLLNPKEARSGRRNGVNIEMFDVASMWNPVEAMDKLMNCKQVDRSPDMPIFRWKSGRLITARFLNSWIRDSQKDALGYPGSSLITSHSFRAGIVTVLGALGVNEEKIKEVGRWHSEAWLRYTKMGRSVRAADQMEIQQLVVDKAMGFSHIPVVEIPRGC